MNAPPKDIFIKISYTEVSLKHRAGLSTHTNFPVLNQGIITLNDIGNKKVGLTTNHQTSTASLKFFVKTLLHC